MGIDCITELDVSLSFESSDEIKKSLLNYCGESTTLTKFRID